MAQKETFTLAHLSDPHLADHHAVRFADLLNKRLFGYLKWRLTRKSKHHPDVVSGLVHDVHLRRPQHIVVTGDLTHLGLPAEYLKAKEMLKTLGPPQQVTIIPGNHDAYVGAAWDRNLVHWTDYIVSDKPAFATDGEGAATKAIFPSLRVRGPLALIGISTARPCSIFLAVGSIGNDQLQRLRKILLETGKRGLFRVILIHHPPVSRVVSWRKRLTDAEAFGTILQQCGAELILHGHAHYHSQVGIKTPQGYTPVVGISSASSTDRNSKRRARYHLYRLKQATDGWQLDVSVRGYANHHQRFVTEREYRLI